MATTRTTAASSPEASPPQGRDQQQNKASPPFATERFSDDISKYGHRSVAETSLPASVTPQHAATRRQRNGPSSSSSSSFTSGALTGAFLALRSTAAPFSPMQPKDAWEKERQRRRAQRSENYLYSWGGTSLPAAATALSTSKTVFNVDDVVKKDASLNAFMQKCREDSRAKGKAELQQMSEEAKRQKQAQLEASAVQAKFKKGLTQFRRQLRDRLRERRDPMRGAVMRVVDEGFAHLFLAQFEAEAAAAAEAAGEGVFVAAPVDAALELIASPLGRASARTYEVAREVMFPSDPVAFDDMGVPVPLLQPPSASLAAVAAPEVAPIQLPMRPGWSAERSGKAGAKLLTIAAKSAKEQQRRRLSVEGSPLLPDRSTAATAVSMALFVKGDTGGGGGGGGGGVTEKGERKGDDDGGEPSRRAPFSLTKSYKSQRGLIQLSDKAAQDSVDEATPPTETAAGATAAAALEDDDTESVASTAFAAEAAAAASAAASSKALESASIASDALSERAADTLHVLITQLDAGQASPTAPVMDDDDVASLSQVGGVAAMASVTSAVTDGGDEEAARLDVVDALGTAADDDAHEGTGAGSPLKLVRARTTGSRAAARTPLNMKFMSVGTSLSPSFARPTSTFVTTDEARRLFAVAPPVPTATPRVWAQPLRNVNGRYVHGRGAPPVGADVSPYRPAPGSQAVLQQSKSMSLSLQKSLVVSPSSTILPPNVRPFFS